MQKCLLIIIAAIIAVACAPVPPSSANGGAETTTTPALTGGTGGSGGSGGCAPTNVDVSVACDGLPSEAIIIPPGLFYAQPLPLIVGNLDSIGFVAVVGKKVDAPNGITYTCALNLSNEVFLAILPATDTKPPLPGDPAWTAFPYPEHVTSQNEEHVSVALSLLPTPVADTQRAWMMWQTTPESHADKELQCLLGCTLPDGEDGLISDDNGPWQIDSTHASVERSAHAQIPCE